MPKIKKTKLVLAAIIISQFIGLQFNVDSSDVSRLLEKLSLKNSSESVEQYFNDREIQDFNKAIKINPDNEVAYYNRGIAYKNMKQYKKAIQDFDKAISLNPNLEAAYINRGVAYMDGLKQYEKAILNFNIAIQLNPNGFDAYNNLGQAYYLSKNYHEAIKNFDRAIELNPNSTLAKNNRELCLKAMNN